MITYQTTRGKVLESAVQIESRISKVIAFLLDIKLKNSKTLGTTNRAISFDQKVSLLTDLNYQPDKNFATAIQLFTEIRNKFAHVEKVNSFVSCFKIIEESSPDKNKRKKFISSMLPEVTTDRDDIDEETYLSLSFEMLCIQINYWLDLIIKFSSRNKKQVFLKSGVIELLRSYIDSRTQKTNNEEESFFKNVELLIKEIETDYELLNDINEYSQQVKK